MSLRSPAGLMRLPVFLAGCAVAAAVFAESVKTLAPAKPAAGGERRVALVIGNSTYKGAALKNPVNDARAMARALSEAGFAVTLAEDQGRAGMNRVIRDFGDTLARGGVGLFYFAGHGMQVRNRNFLIPVDAQIEREDEIEFNSVDANLVLSKMDSAKNATNLVILDACRNNPFARSFKLGATGLAQMDAPSGTLIAFATAPGQVASDGDGDNGVYTKHLLAQIRNPGLPVEQLFKQVRNGVMADTKERQVPWESSSLRGDFFFLQQSPQAIAEDQRRSQQQAIDKAVGEAVRQADERAARDRAELQQRMEQMIEAALARQRAMLEAERKGVPAASAVPPPVALAPPIAAATVPVPQSAAPSPPTEPAKVALPAQASQASAPVARQGDRWQYAGVDANRRDTKFEFLMEVEGAASAGVLETIQGRSGEPVQWVHTIAPALTGIVPGWVAFSPLSVAEGRLEVGRTWKEITVDRVDACSRSTVICYAQARVVARESVKIAGRTFDTAKIEVQVVLRGLVSFATPATRELTYWYSEEVRRPVRFTSRAVGNAAFIPDRNIEMELVAYQLGGAAPVGNIDPALTARR